MDNYQRLSYLLGHYDWRVYLTDAACVDIGRGSFGLIDKIDIIPPGVKGLVGSIGQFCEAAASSVIMTVGHHRNELPVNITFHNAYSIALAISTDDLRSHPLEPINIGNAVVISHGAKILPGCRLNDGAVIGAGAVVADDVDAFSVVAGVPSRLLRQRFEPAVQRSISAVRWWDFETTYMMENLHRLQQLAVDETTSHRYRTPTPKLAMLLLRTPDTLETNIKILGYVDGTKQVSMNEAPERIRNYVAGAFSNNPPQQPIFDLWG